MGLGGVYCAQYIGFTAVNIVDKKMGQRCMFSLMRSTVYVEFIKATVLTKELLELCNSCKLSTTHSHDSSTSRSKQCVYLATG